MSDNTVLQQELATLKAKFQQALVVIKTVSAENETMRGQIASLQPSPSTTPEVIEADDEFEQLERENDLLKKQLEEIKGQFEKVKNENDKMKSDGDKIKVENDKLRQFCERVKVEYTQIKNENTLIKADKKRLEDELVEKDDKITQLDNNIKDLNSKVADNINKASQTDLNDDVISNQQNDEYEKVRVQLREMELDYNNIKSQLLTQNDTNNIIESKNSMIESLNIDIEALQNDLDSVRKLNENLENELFNEKDSHLTTKSTLSTSQSQLLSLTQQFDDLQRVNVEQQATVAHCEQQVYELEAKLIASTSTNTTTETVATELQQVLLRAQTLQKKLDLATISSDKLQGDHHDELLLQSQTHQDELLAQQSLYETRLNELQQTIDLIQQQHDSDKVVNQTILEERNNCIEGLTAEINQYKDQIKELESRIVQLDDNLHNTIVQHEQHVQLITLEFNEKEELFTFQQKTLEDDIISLQSQLEHFKVELQQYQQQQQGQFSDYEDNLSSSSQINYLHQSNDIYTSNTNNDHSNTSFTSVQSSSLNHNNKKRSMNQAYNIDSISKAAEQQRQLDLLTMEHNNDKKDIFNYIDVLRKKIIIANSYIEFITKQLELTLTVQKRNNVDIDYVKNIILRFILFQKLGLDSQRDAMVPVIGQLLHFSQQDFAMLISAEKKFKEMGNNNSWWGGGGGGASSGSATRSFTDAIQHNLELDYDPMSSIQSQSVPLSQQSKIIKNDGGEGDAIGSSSSGGGKREQISFDNKNFSQNDNNNNINNMSSGMNEDISLTYLKPGRTLSYNGMVCSIKDLQPPAFIEPVPITIKQLGYNE